MVRHTHASDPGLRRNAQDSGDRKRRGLGPAAEARVTEVSQGACLCAALRVDVVAPGHFVFQVRDDGLKLREGGPLDGLPGEAGLHGEGVGERHARRHVGEVRVAGEGLAAGGLPVRGAAAVGLTAIPRSTRAAAVAVAAVAATWGPAHGADRNGETPTGPGPARAVGSVDERGRGRKDCCSHKGDG